MAERRYIGLDAGSISVKLIVQDEGLRIIHESYERHYGQPLKVAMNLLEKTEPANCLGITGSVGKLLASILSVEFVNDIIAQSTAVSRFYPGIKTIIEMGGECSRLIILENGILKDFSMNSICAAGTCSFLDQQAERLNLTIEEFAELAMKSKKPPRIAGRCSVFAKSDMIHLQQIATPDYDIIAGLCFAVARNFKSTICSGKKIHTPVIFIGGAASNKGVVRAFREVFELGDNLVIPEHHLTMGAIGAAMMAAKKLVNGELQAKEEYIKKLEEYLRSADGYQGEGLTPLKIQGSELRVDSLNTCQIQTSNSQLSTLNSQLPKIPAYLGIDVGSISTNLAVLDEDKNLLAKRYLMTAGRPIEAVRKGLDEIGDEIGDYVVIKGVGTTGSGRYMIADFVGADIVKNEITAQATAAIEIDATVDTIFEIGGQDSKYISIDNGVIVDFEMNKVCAAGTGSFLEEQAEKLSISIKDEFSDMALSSCSPCRLGERCTVFMETALVSNLQRGAPKDNLVAGLSYSIVYNYLNRVVGDKRIGNNIFFQGGVAFNRGVVAAFEKVLGRRITVPPDHDVTGAIGMALIAMRYMKGSYELRVKSYELKDKENSRLNSELRTLNSKLQTKFKGFGLSKRNYTINPFECKGCSNLCEIKQVKIEGEGSSLFYGSRCEKYDVKRKSRAEEIPDLFKRREELLTAAYERCINNTQHSTVSFPDTRPKIGLPWMLFFQEYLPFWGTLLRELGFNVVLSDKTNRSIINSGVESVVVETCFPIKVAHGHVLDLIQKGVDTIFVPSFINLNTEKDIYRRGVSCPYVQTIPYVLKTIVKDIDIVRPVVDMSRGRGFLENEIKNVFEKYNLSIRSIRRAIDTAFKAQAEFYNAIQKEGSKILKDVSEGKYPRAIVIVGRSYNSVDSGVNLDIPRKLRDMDVIPIPMDFLPLNTIDISDEFPNMYWRSGQRILGAAEFIRKNKYLNAIYITNFGCGPDAFIIRYFKERMGGKHFLQIEIDEHSADAGVITRCEAFLDSIENIGNVAIDEIKRLRTVTINRGSRERRTLYIPRMADHAFALAAAFQGSGVDAEVLPESDADTVELGRKYTSGKECYPCTLTTGDMVKMVKSSGFRPEKSAFFMPSGTGPCRFGQYNFFQRLVLDELGYNGVPIYSPNQDSTFYKELGIVGSDFIKKAWMGIVASELLIKSIHETRPYEKNKGETEALYRTYLPKVADAIRSKDGVIEVLRDARRDFEAIPVCRDIKKPLIGILGEIFVRFNAFSNENIIKKIEALGGEVWLSPFEEWLYYVNYMAIKKAWLKREYLALTDILIKYIYQKKVEHRFAKEFDGYLKSLHEPTTLKILSNASPYVHRSFEGETILSIGKGVDFVMRGTAGIVNTMPFNCMPGTIVTALLKKVSEDHDNISVLNMAYDGQEHAGSETKIEAFMHQAKQRWEKKL
ncbi:MAG: acyl-CoA dehydratase activase [Nitrospirota bacterium]